MPGEEEAYETPKWRSLWLSLGFVLLVGIGVVTVLRPELEDEQNDDAAAQIESGNAQVPEEPPQE